jgi:hypothetical protein
MRAEHVGVVGVEDRRLDRTAEQGFRVMHEIRVERVVSGDQHRDRLLAGPAGTAGLLPHRGPCAGEAGQQHGVEARHVDTEFECGGGRQTEQRAVTKGSFERSAFLRKVAGSIRRDPAAQVARDIIEVASRSKRHCFGSPTRPHERDGPDAIDDEVGEQVGRFGHHRSPHLRTVLTTLGAEIDQRWFPQHELRGTAR